MATIYHDYGPGDETYHCPQRKQIRRDSVELRETVRRLSESEVRRTTERRRKSEIIDEKVSVLGSVQSMRQGKLPSNEQLNKVMNKLLNSKSIETNKHHMSADGQLLLKDFQELLLTFQRALQTKNRDELFQSMIYHVKKSEASLGDIKPSIEGDTQQKEQAKGDAKTGAGAILKVAKLFLFNAQFKGVLEQILNIAQQTMGGVLQESGKALDNHANSETNPVDDGNNNSLGNKVRDAASEMTNSNDQGSSNDQNTMKDKIRNAAAGIAGGAAVGGGASHLASNHQDGNSSNSSQHLQTRDMNSQSRDMNSQSRDMNSQSRDMNSQFKENNTHLPKDYQNFLEHRFVDYESPAPATDDAGHTLDQDIEHGAVPHSSEFISARQLSNKKRPQQVQSQSSKSNSGAYPTNEQVFLRNASANQPAATKRSRGTSVPNVPQHQMFMTNPTAVQPTATESAGGMSKQASGIPSSTANELQRNESPSSFTDMGKVGSTNQDKFKHEQFYGNHMDVYDSNLNQPKPSSGKAPGIATVGQGATAATAASLGMAGYLHKKQGVHNESPSSFPGSGAVGDTDHGRLKPEQFYGNHMGVEDSVMNQPKSMGNNENQVLSHQQEQYYNNTKGIQQPRQTSHSSGAPHSDNGDSDIRRKLNAAVPKYAPGAKSASDEYIQSRFDSPSGGGNAFLHKRLNAAVPHSSNADNNPQSLSFVGMDDEQHQQQGHQQSNNMLTDLNHSAQEANEDFLHKRLDRQTIPLTNNQTLSPKSHISAGAGYNLKEDNHTVPAKEIVETLRRPSATGNGSHIEDQVKAHAQSFPGQHVMDKLDFTTASGGALVNPQQQQNPQTRQLPNPVQDHLNDFRGDHVMDRIDDSKNQTITHTTGESRNAGIGTAGLMAASAGGAAMLGNRQQNQSKAKDPKLTEKSNTGAPIADYPAGYLDKDLPSIEPDASTHSVIHERNATSSRPKRNSFHDNHMYQGVDGQRHIDDGSNTKPIISNREAVRRMSSGENIDLDAHPTKPGSEIGATSALGAGTGAGAAAGATAAVAATSNRKQQTKDDKSQTSGDLPNKDTRISANKIVNKMKQKTGTDGEVAKDEGEQDSISASEIISKLKEILITVQKNPEYQEAMSTLMSLFDTWGNRLKTGQMDRRRSSAVPLPEQNEYYKTTAAYEAKTIIEDWAQGKSLDPILQQFIDISAKLKQDDTLKNLKQKIIVYIQKMLQEPGYLSGNESTEDGSKLVDEVRHSALEEYKPQVKSMIQESSVIVKSVSDDPISRKISEKVKAIHNHLWYDSNGHAAFKPHLLNDMRITFIPALIEQIKYVPLPQIVYSDKQFEIAIENMILQGDTLMPDIFEVKADDYLRFSPKANVSFTNSQSVHVHMTGIQTTMEDVVFYYRRKSGFPKLSDSGVVSVATGGAGLRASLRIVSSSVDQRHTFRIDQCHCHIDKLNIKVNHSKHNTLYKVLNPMMTGIIKRQMCKAIENKLITTFEQGDAKITKHIIDKKLSEETPIKDARRPGLFSHLIKMMNQKVSSI